MTDICYSTT